VVERKGVTVKREVKRKVEPKMEPNAGLFQPDGGRQAF
jgi:hypothetical protein